MAIVTHENDLAAFRDRHGGRALLDRLPVAGAALVNWPVGVGKSFAIDDAVEAAVEGATPRYDLAVVLCARHAIINERRHVRSHGHGIPLKVLEPRPRTRCGELDAAWVGYEHRGLGSLGRDELCGRCPNRSGCDWPAQYTSQRLRGVQVIYATHTHLRIDPGFVERLVRLTGATRPLVIIDEADWLFQNYRYAIEPGDLARFSAVMAELETAPDASPLVGRWRHYAETLARAEDRDLAVNSWRTPPLPPTLIGEVQRAGLRLHGNDFRFIGHVLEQFGRSPVNSRELTLSGAIAFTAVPVFNGPVLIFSATLSADLISWRLDRSVDDLFPDLRVFHEGTCWFNLRSKLGTARHFPGNADQILDFFGMLVSKRLGEGRWPLLVCRKQFVRHVVDEISKRLRWLGHGDRVTVVAADQVDAAVAEGRIVVPVLHYGMVGVNAFEVYDCCYCVSGYYVNGHAVDDAVQGLLATDEHVPLEIGPSQPGGERVAGTRSVRDRVFDHHRMAPKALEALEHAAVIQAVGRVRPFTKPREVITFQTADLPGVSYEREFTNLDQAREHFATPKLRDLEAALRSAETRQLIDAGLTTQQAAKSQGVSLRTVQRHLAAPHEMPEAWRSIFANLDQFPELSR